MATGRRVSRVAELIRREISEMLLHGIKDERVGSWHGQRYRCGCIWRSATCQGVCQHLRHR